MPARLRCFEKQIWISFRFRKWKATRPEEWIILRINQEGWARDLVEELPGARLLPIIGGVTKAVQARGVAVVKLLESAQIATPARIDLARKLHRFRFYLADQAVD